MLIIICVLLFGFCFAGCKFLEGLFSALLIGGLLALLIVVYFIGKFFY